MVTPPSPTRKSAFTLVELLVVIGIIALLIGVLLPVLAKARRSARDLACANNLRQLGVGVQGYATAFKGALPWEGFAEGDRAIRHVGPWEDPSQWFNATAAYAGQTPYVDLQAADTVGKEPLPRDEGKASLFVCPDSGPAVAGPKDDLVQDGYFMLWGMNADSTHTERRKTFWSYGYNTQLDGGIEDRHSTDRVTLRITAIPRSSETPILVEKLMRPKEFDPPFASSIGQSEVSWREFTTRHHGGGYLLFLDGHVAFFTRKEIINAPNAPADYNQPGTVIWNPGGVSN